MNFECRKISLNIFQIKMVKDKVVNEKRLFLSIEAIFNIFVARLTTKIPKINTFFNKTVFFC
jgi:hypothetical protein